MNRSCIFVLACAVALSAQALCRDVESSWNQDSVSVDGWAPEWKGETYSYFDDNQTALAVRNDGRNLFVIFLTRDRRYLRILARGGITIWFNPKANKDKSLGVEFKRLHNMKIPDSEFDDQFPEFKKGLSSRDTTTSLTLISNGEREALNLGAAVGIKAASTVENGTYCCETMISLAVLEAHGIVLNDLKNGKLGLGLESLKFERPETQSGDPFGGTFGSGRRPSSGRAGGPRRDFARPEQLRMWVEVIPAQSRN